MTTPHNIEARRNPGALYRIGYDAAGYACKVYGDARNGYTVHGYYHRTLAEVSARLSTITTAARSAAP